MLGWTWGCSSCFLLLLLLVVVVCFVVVFVVFLLFGCFFMLLCCSLAAFWRSFPCFFVKAIMLSFQERKRAIINLIFVVYIYNIYRIPKPRRSHDLLLSEIMLFCSRAKDHFDVLLSDAPFLLPYALFLLPHASLLPSSAPSCPLLPPSCSFSSAAFYSQHPTLFPPPLTRLRYQPSSEVTTSHAQDSGVGSSGSLDSRNRNHIISLILKIIAVLTQVLSFFPFGC